MFGDLSGMMDKLKKAQEEVEKTKTRLDTVLVDETSADGKIKITLTFDFILLSKYYTIANEFFNWSTG